MWSSVWKARLGLYGGGASERCWLLRVVFWVVFFVCGDCNSFVKNVVILLLYVVYGVSNGSSMDLVHRWRRWAGGDEDGDCFLLKKKEEEWSAQIAIIKRASNRINVLEANSWMWTKNGTDSNYNGSMTWNFATTNFFLEKKRTTNCPPTIITRFVVPYSYNNNLFLTSFHPVSLQAPHNMNKAYFWMPFVLAKNRRKTTPSIAKSTYKPPLTPPTTSPCLLNKYNDHIPNRTHVENQNP